MSDSRDNILVKIVEKIQDTRYLVLIGIVITVLPSTILGNTFLVVVTVSLAFACLIVFALLDFWTSRHVTGVGAWVALRFPADVDPSQVRIQRCDYRIEDPRRPTVSRKGTVRGHSSRQWMDLRGSA